MEPIDPCAMTMPEVLWAPYQEFGIPDPAQQTLEPPAHPITIGSVGYRGNEIILYWQPADYDRDPAALAWAREKVQREINRFRMFEEAAKERGERERASLWRKFAAFLVMEFIGGEGCNIAAFDERRPLLPPPGKEPVTL